jgi:hypothetical protein
MSVIDTMPSLGSTQTRPDPIARSGGEADDQGHFSPAWSSQEGFTCEARLAGVIGVCTSLQVSKGARPGSQEH